MSINTLPDVIGEGLVQAVAAPWAISVWLIIAVSLVRRDARQKYQDFLTAFGLTGFCILGLGVQYATAWLIPHPIDAKLMAIDNFLHLNPLRFMQWCLHMPAVSLILLVSYNLIPLIIGIAWVWEQNEIMRRSLLIGGVICWPFFFLVPAIGPIHVLTGDRSVGTTCFPSMHLTWTLLTAINSKTNMKYALWGFVGLTAASTVGLGQHYFIDLIAAIPYAFAIQKIATYCSRPHWKETPGEQTNVGDIVWTNAEHSN